MDLNLLSDERDVVRMAGALQLLARVCKHEAVNAKAHKISFDAQGTGLADVEDKLARAAAAGEGGEAAGNLVGSGEPLVSWMRRVVGDTQHAAGTCRMGPAGAADSVVDSGCLVQGSSNMHVVDASVMPHVVRANTHLTCIMLGEKGAHMLLHEQSEAAA